MKVDHAKSGSVFEWDKSRGAGSLYLFELLEEAAPKAGPVRWTSLENLELVGVSIDSKSLDHLLEALQMRAQSSRYSNKCTLTTRHCSLSALSLHRPIPDVKDLAWPDVQKMFEKMQAEMGAAQNYMDAMDA
jgi:hypothetical protein